MDPIERVIAIREAEQRWDWYFDMFCESYDIYSDRQMFIDARKYMQAQKEAADHQLMMLKLQLRLIEYDMENPTIR